MAEPQKSESQRKQSFTYVIRDQFGQYYDIEPEALEKFKMNDDQVETFLRSIAHTWGSYCGPQGPCGPFPSSFVRVVPSSFVRAVPSQFVRAAPSQFVRAVPSAYARAVPSQFVRAVPSSVVRAVPSSVVRAVPSSVVRAVPSQFVRAVPSQFVRAVPSSIVRFTPATGGGSATFAAPEGPESPALQVPFAGGMQIWLRARE